MNILYLCDEYPPGRHGGIGTAVQLLARQMVAMGHTVVVAGFYDWGYGGADEEDDNGVKVFRFRRKLDARWFGKKNALPVRAAYKLFRLSGIFQWDIEKSLQKYRIYVEDIISKFNIEIIEAPDFNEYVQFCTKYTPFPKLSVPTVVKLHGSLTYFLKEAGQTVPDFIFNMDKAVLDNATAVLSVSRYTADKTSSYMHYGKDIAVVYNGVDTHIALSAAKSTNLVVFSGSLVPKKGIYQLIKAWNRVNKTVPSAQLYVYGKGPIEKIKEDANADALQTIHFEGHVPRNRLLEQLAAAAVAVFPSYAESFGLAPVEAMSCGATVIFSNRTSGPEIVQDNVTGLLADPDNVEELAGKIIYLLQHPDVAKELAMKARQSVAQKFDIQVVATKNIENYTKVLQDQGSLPK